MTSARRSGRGPRLLSGVVALAVAASLLLAGCTDEPEPEPNRPATPAAKKTRLTFGVWGTTPEVQAYRDVVSGYNAEAEAVEVSVKAWDDARSMMAALRGGGEVPDLFMITRNQLPDVRERELHTPLLDLLDERGVDYGDGHYRDAIAAFSGNDNLDCMPYGVAPMVVYYNTELIDFERMRERERPAPDEGKEHERWSLDQFAAAAQFGTRPRKNTRGVYVEPSLTGLAPFIYSGGGKLFDDTEEPKSLAFSDEDTREALSRALEVLRDPTVTLGEEQLERASAEKWFERGKLAMLPGYRDLTPQLRQVEGLEFDVMPMPVLDDRATVGDFSGLCISDDSASISQTADFLVHVIGTESVEEVARAGFLAPANFEVATSEAFLQPDRMPAHAGVFNASVTNMVLSPLLDERGELEDAVRASLRQLLRNPVLDLEALTTEIDEESRAVLDPDYEPESPDGEGEDSDAEDDPDSDSE